MKRYGIAMALVTLAVLVSFGVVEALDFPVLTEPTGVVTGGGVLAAVAGVGLLVVDVVLPVPSSVVMLAHGAAFGVVAGAMLSLAGIVGAALFGVWLGQRGERLLGVSDRDRQRARQLVDRWGVVSVIVTRPVPVLAEAVVVMAGSAGASPVKVGVAAAAGGVPAAVLYALAGSVARGAVSGVVVFALVLGIAAVAFVVAARREPRSALGRV